MRVRVGTCTLCGRDAVANWIGGAGAIYVCDSCVTYELPALLADAAWLPAKGGADVAKRTIERAESVYWRALALRLMSEREATT